MEKFSTLEELQHLLETNGFLTNILSESLWKNFQQHGVTSMYDIFGKWNKMKRSREEFSKWLQLFQKSQKSTDDESARNDLISFLESKTKYL
jgi:hypothetical protein